MLKKEKNDRFSIIYEILLYTYMIFVPAINIITTMINKFDVFKVSDIVMWFSFFICFITFIMFIIEIKSGKKIEFSKIKKELVLFLLFIIWCFISTLFSSNFQNSLLGIRVRYCGFIQLLSFFMFGYLGYSLSEKGRIRFLRFFLLISTIIAFLSIAQNYYTLSILPSYNHYPAYTGFFYNINHYGYYLVYATVISIFIFIYDKNKILKIIDFFVYVLNVYVLIRNNTFGCYVAVMLSIIILFFYILKSKNIRNYLYLFIIIPFVFLSIFVNDDGYYYAKENFYELLTDLNIIVETPIEEDITDSYLNPIWDVGSYRGSLWIHGVVYTLEKPIFGYGLDNLEDRFLEDNIDIDSPHNLIFNFSTTIGIPGMLFYILGLIITLINCIKNLKKENIIMNMCCFVIIAHIISSMFGLTIYYVTVYFVIVLGMTLKFLTDIDDKDKKVI